MTPMRLRRSATPAHPDRLRTMFTSSMRTMTGDPMDGSNSEWRRVGVGDVLVSQNAKDLLTTNGAVGSCVAVYLWDPESRVGGLLHFEWPDSASDPMRAQNEPAVFADTGVLLLLERAGLMGAAKGRCKVRLVGGA